jgi:hypothetical protein
MSREQTRDFCVYLASSEDYSPKNLPQREQNQLNLFIQYLIDRLGARHPLVEFAIKGIAYHHGWLPRDVRTEIEHAFSRHWVRVLASTTTLIDGVNFPISTFILANYERRISDNLVWRLEKKDFQNMIGRAGRAIFDTEGQIIFMIPPNLFIPNVWQDYLFTRADDPERLVLSSLNRQDFRMEILKYILDTMGDPITAASFLAVDPEAWNTEYGVGAKDIGETILRLQAFLLALTDKEVLDPENIETIRRFFNRTLFGQQQPEDDLLQLITRFTQTTGQLMARVEPNRQRRGVYGKIGLGFTSCHNLYQVARDFWLSYGAEMFNKNREHITSDFLSNVGNLALSFPEVRPERVKIPHTRRPVRYLDLEPGEILSKWIVTLSLQSSIEEEYFKEIEHLGERAEACANFIRDAFEYKAPWVLSAFNIFVSHIAETEANIIEFGSTPLGRQLSMLPAYAKFGVNNPAAAFFSMIGVSIRQMAILLGNYYSQENPERYYDFSLMLDWILRLEAEQVTEWFQARYGEDVAGQVSRLFRFLDLLRSQEQSLEDILPHEFAIAGWQYYQGGQVISQMMAGDEISLKPDPLNPWDAYAVEISNKQGVKLGFIPRELSRAVYNHIVSEIPLNCIVINIDEGDKFHPVKIRLDAPEV